MATAGVDLGGSKIAGVLLDESGKIDGSVWREHDCRDAAGALALILDVVADLGRRRSLAGVGVALAGWLDAHRGEVLRAANLGVAFTPLQQQLAERLGRPILLENDGNAAAYAEAVRGGGRRARVLVTLVLGTGVGGGIVHDGRLLVGTHGLAGELGHLQVRDDGHRCVCGGTGCLELYASGVAVAAGAREVAVTGAADAILRLADGDVASISSSHVVIAARAGDAVATRLLSDAGRAIGRAVAHLVPVLDPDLVLLAGSLACAADELMIEPARAELRRRLPLSVVLSPVPIRLGTCGPAAAAVGVAELARATFTTEASNAPPTTGGIGRV